MPRDVHIQEKEVRQTSFGQALYIRVFTDNYRQLSWSEVWEAFARQYPDKWAVQFFPPQHMLVDEENIYHLFVMDEVPWGMEIGRHSRHPAHCHGPEYR